MEIRQADTLTEADEHRLFGWGVDVFGTADLDLTFRPKDVHFLLYTDEGLASHAGLLQHVIRVNGTEATVAGLGGVATVLQAQRRGYARAVVTHAMAVLRGWNIDGGLLFCISRMVPYYEKLGWHLVDAPVLIEQPRGIIRSPMHVMVMPCTERLRSIEAVELNSFPW